MTCDRLEPLIEAIVDDAVDVSAEDRAHLDSCDRCRARLAAARAIEGVLARRDAATPPASFTTTVMSLVVQERWKAERVVDLGFNLALAAAVAVIIAAGAGLAWSLGFFTITVDLGAVEAFGGNGLAVRLAAQAQTVAMAAVLLTGALGLWWWVEADSA